MSACLLPERPAGVGQRKGGGVKGFLDKKAVPSGQ